MTNQKMFHASRTGAVIALIVASLLVAPLATIPANAQLFRSTATPAGQVKPGMSRGKKVALIAGAALLYYLYRRHLAAQAAQQAQQQPQVAAGQAPMARQQTPQLYRSKNGGVYYRDPQGKPVWLTVPQQPVQVSTDDLQRYAPDYNRYSGPAPAAPQGYRTQPFTQFAPEAAGSMQ